MQFLSFRQTYAAGIIATQKQVFQQPFSRSLSERILPLPGNPGLISERQPVVLEFRIAHHHGPEGLVTLGERQSLLHWGIDIGSGIEITCPTRSEPQRESRQFQICESYYACCLSRWKGRLSVSHDQMVRVSEYPILPVFPHLNRTVKMHWLCHFRMIRDHDSHPVNHDRGQLLHFIASIDY
jgi:hypothetical protein